MGQLLHVVAPNRAGDYEMPFSVAQLVFQSITDPEFTGTVWLSLIALQSLDPISWPLQYRSGAQAEAVLDTFDGSIQ